MGKFQPDNDFLDYLVQRHEDPDKDVEWFPDRPEGVEGFSCSFRELIDFVRTGNKGVRATYERFWDTYGEDYQKQKGIK